MKKRHNKIDWNKIPQTNIPVINERYLNKLSVDNTVETSVLEDKPQIYAEDRKTVEILGRVYYAD